MVYYNRRRFILATQRDLYATTDDAPQWERYIKLCIVSKKGCPLMNRANRNNCSNPTTTAAAAPSNWVSEINSGDAVPMPTSHILQRLTVTECRAPFTVRQNPWRNIWTATSAAAIPSPGATIHPLARSRRTPTMKVWNRIQKPPSPPLLNVEDAGWYAQKLIKSFRWLFGFKILLFSKLLQIKINFELDY